MRYTNAIPLQIGDFQLTAGFVHPTGMIESVMADQRRNLLVNYWYAHPVGHAIEGLRYALGYRAADLDLRVGQPAAERRHAG